MFTRAIAGLLGMLEWVGLPAAVPEPEHARTTFNEGGSAEFYMHGGGRFYVPQPSNAVSHAAVVQHLPLIGDAPTYEVRGRPCWGVPCVSFQAWNADAYAQSPLLHEQVAVEPLGLFGTNPKGERVFREIGRVRVQREMLCIAALFGVCLGVALSFLAR